MNKSIRKTVYLALLVAVGLILGIVESWLPMPFSVPGFKLGVSNVVGLMVILMYSLKEGIAVVGLKSILFSLATGNIMALPYSLAGGILSVFIMYLGLRYLKNQLSLIGISILGALAHNLGQVIIGILIIENWRLIIYYPYMALISIFSGGFIGFVGLYLSKYSKHFSAI